MLQPRPDSPATTLALDVIFMPLHPWLAPCTAHTAAQLQSTEGNLVTQSQEVLRPTVKGHRVCSRGSQGRSQRHHPKLQYKNGTHQVGIPIFNGVRGWSRQVSKAGCVGGVVVSGHQDTLQGVRPHGQA